MNKRIMDRCWPLQMPATAKAVLIALASEANEEGMCIPSLSVLITKTCFERSAIIDAVKLLEARGALQAERFKGKPTIFTMQPHRYEDSDPFSPNDDGSESSRPEPLVKKKRIPPGTTLAGTSSGFQRFWGAYPNGGRKVGLAKCWEAWTRRNLEPLADEIEAHVRAMSCCHKWRNGYEPLTMTYLNGSMWNDPIPAAGPRNEASAYLEETMYGTGNSQATGHDADALRRGVPAQVAGLQPTRNG